MSDLERAMRLHRGFREADPKRAKKIDVELPKAVAHIGTVEFIGYMTTHRGKTQLYIHEFAAGSRPKMYASGKRNQLFLFGGRFTVTDRGITDLDNTGKVVHARRRYDVKLKGS